MSALSGIGLAVAGLAMALPHEAAMLLTTLPRAATDAATGLSKLYQVHATSRAHPAFQARDQAATALVNQKKEEWAGQQGSSTTPEPAFDAFCSEFQEELRAVFPEPSRPGPGPEVRTETGRAIVALSSAISQVDSRQGSVLSLPTDADPHRAGEVNALQGIGWLSPFMLAGVSALAHSGLAVGL
ncbi:hypothetical protein JI739_21690 [Ramlibacter sp. AW1]|uniref:Uncharacterized protein n=1 Tax=Ramlibacter aurantiacus TaxID=2801330 RepID=A0A936ZKE6_9BURK|nr:hypothetical protein [Ramlibacter aurantiacus]MBL0422964.1 hypothetical protein [Ramlibacter aurantiacus]